MGIAPLPLVRVRDAGRPAIAAAVALLLLTACRHNSSPVAAAPQKTPTPPARHEDGKPVQAQMRHVDYHVLPSAVLNIDRLRGELLTTTPGKPPVFDAKDSFVMAIGSAEIAISQESLSGLLNDYVFAYDGSPLEKLEVSIEPGRILQKGTLRKALKISFSIEGTVSATPNGEIRLHPTSVKAAGIAVRGLMEKFGLEIDQLLKLKVDRGVRVEGDDFLLSPDRMLPPPRIEGRVAAVRLEPGKMVLTLTSREGTAKPPLSPPDKASPNYMYYEGGTLVFGKLTMKGTDLQIIDADPRDPFDFDLDHYNDQLVAGYSKNLPDKGLVVHMPDYGKLAKPGVARDKPQVAGIAPARQSPP